MERISEYQTLLTEAVAKINGEELSTIDFDDLKAGLTDVVALLGGAMRGDRELTRLTQDYIARISGMEKAIAVARRGNGHLNRALDLIETLSALTANQLIEQYTRTQARFRDAFPTSFGMLDRRQPGGGRRNINEYK